TLIFFFFSSRRRHTRFSRDWSSDVCSSDLSVEACLAGPKRPQDRVALPLVSKAFDDFLGLQLKPSSKEEGRLLNEGGGGTAVGRSEERRVGKECGSRWSL